MANVPLHEINSFVSKYVALWKAGQDASLHLDTYAGQVYVSLQLRLGHYPQNQQNTPRKKVTPSQLRRRERRSAARQSSAEQADVAKLDSFIDIMDVSEKEADTCITSLCKLENLQAKANCTAENVVMDCHEKCDMDTEKDVKSDEEYDTYLFSYWDNKKQGNSKEAIECISNNLTYNFSKNGVLEKDRVFDIFEVTEHEDNENEIELKVKLRKNNWPVELSARNCQTGIGDIPVTVSIKRILR